MKIAISGSTGLVGSYLCEYLSKEPGVEVLRIPRQLLYDRDGNLSNYLEGADVIIHLSGASVISRWTKKRKRILRESRITTTLNIFKALSKLKEKPKQFICASAVGIYSSEGVHNEGSNSYASGFLGQLCKDWEKAAFKITELGIKTSVFRLGLVLSDKGGIIEQIRPIFKLGLGGRIGSGEQAFPFIHIDDLAGAFKHVITTNSEGVYNLVAPELSTNKDFTRLASFYASLPAFLHVPSTLLRVILGEASSVLLTGQKILPDRLKKERYSFKYLTLDSILNEFFS